MPDVTINYWAILVCGVAYQMIGVLWYSPVFFGKVWMKLLGKTEKDMKDLRKGATFNYISSFFLALVMAYILSHLIDYAQASTIGDGLMVAALVWVGFVVTTNLLPVLYEARKTGLFLIQIIYLLISLLVMGIILVLWV